MDPVRILGGGLAGMATALLLARRGVAVEVRDRLGGCGGRFGGGFQILENGSCRRDVLDELAAAGLRPQCDLVPMHSALLLDKDMRRYEVISEEPYAYLVQRGAGGGTVDAWLRRAADEAGVRVEKGTSGDGWRPHVVATGPRRADGVARERVFRTDHPDLIAVLFDPDLTPTGYSYLFVHDGQGTLGAAQVRHLDRLRGNARRAFERLLSEFPMRMDGEEEKVLFMNFGLPRHLLFDGFWYVGEAAGVQEFLFGLGNRLGLRSASLAAAAIAGDGWDEEGFRRLVVDPMRASILGRAMYELASPRLAARACRWLAGGDFRERLLALQRPSRWRQWLAVAVMAAWRQPGGCRHIPVARWCRRNG